MKNGGQAFPSEFFETEHGDRVEAFAGSPGMTLRDWFAGQALVGLTQTDPWADPQRHATIAYALANAMLAERDKQ